MSAKYFHKTNIRNKIRHEGREILFDPIAGHEGVRKLDTDKESSVIETIEDHIRQRIGGVTEITAKEFKDLKKNHSAKGWGSPQVISANTLPRQDLSIPSAKSPTPSPQAPAAETESKSDEAPAAPSTPAVAPVPAASDF